jgi:very-short-patch-repair endonuclease
MLKCQYCAKECKNKNSNSNHERLCRKNPNKQISNFTHCKEPWNKGLTKDDLRVAAHAKQVSDTLLGRPSTTVWTDEMRKAKSEWRKKLHKEHPETHPNRRLAGNRNKISYPERVAFDYLKSLGVEFEHQKQVGKYFPDFVIGNVIIEIDGEHWHNKEKDAARDKELEELGYKIYRINTKEHIEIKIKELLGVG